MGIELICQPGKTVTWDTFMRYRRNSIAIDGYCSGIPRATPDGHTVNINHHEDVDPIVVTSSCEQAYRLVKMGLFDVMKRKGELDARLYVNDADQDVAWATFILMYPDLVDRPKLKALVQLEDHLDMSNGLWPIDPDSRKNLLPELCWIHEPYTTLRANGKHQDLTPESMGKLIRKMHTRIKACLYGRGKKIQPDIEFEELAQFPLWSFVKETGSHARYGMSAQNIRAFCTLLSQSDGVSRYSLGRLSHVIPFPLPLLYDDLNEAEGIKPDAEQRWGGSLNGGGSPRKIGSKLNIFEVTEVLNKRLKRTREWREAMREKELARQKAEKEKDKPKKNGKGSKGKPKKKG